MSFLKEGLANRLCKRLGWALGAAPEAGRAGSRALVMAVFWTVLTFIVIYWLILSHQGIDTGLAVLTAGVTHASMWAMAGITVHEFMPLSVMLPHLIGGLIGWGLIQELIETAGGGRAEWVSQMPRAPRKVFYGRRQCFRA